MSMDNKFELGELLLIYDALLRLPISIVLNAGEMPSGVKYQSVSRRDLLTKVKELGKQLENAGGLI